MQKNKSNILTYQHAYTTTSEPQIFPAYKMQAVRKYTIYTWQNKVSRSAYIPGSMRFLRISVPVAVAFIRQTLASSRQDWPWSPHSLTDTHTHTHINACIETTHQRQTNICLLYIVLRTCVICVQVKKFSIHKSSEYADKDKFTITTLQKIYVTDVYT